MAVALDSNVVIAFLDSSDALHEPAKTRFRELLHDGEALCVSAVTVAEVLTGAELGHHDREIVLGFFDALIGEVVPVDEAIAMRAAALRADRKSLRIPDALILATADARPEIDRIVCADERAAKLTGLACEIESIAG
jgi:predicted nucleic acid-binding protein